MALLLSLSASAEPEVTIRVNPQTGFVPLTISALVRVEPHPMNRELCLFWYVDPDFVNRSCQQLEGEASKRIYQFYRVLREAGDWNIVARVERSVGSSVQASQTVIVIGR